MKKVLFLLLAVLPLLIVGCDKDEDDEPKEEINIIVSSSQIEIYNGIEVTFTANANGGDTKDATFYFDGQSIGSSISQPYTVKHKLKDVEPGNHTVSCIVNSKQGNEFQGETIVSLKLRLGDEYQGGKIFKLSADGKNGLIASMEDFKYLDEIDMEQVRIAWGYGSATLGTDLDNGKANTILMATSAQYPSEAGYHFKNGYNYNGYNDWYIPAYHELELLKTNKSYVGNFSNLTDWNAMYWSSSESNATQAFILNFNALMGNYNEKNRVFKIRPIRQF